MSSNSGLLFLTKGQTLSFTFTGNFCYRIFASADLSFSVYKPWRYFGVTSVPAVRHVMSLNRFGKKAQKNIFFFFSSLMRCATETVFFLYEHEYQEQELKRREGEWEGGSITELEPRKSTQTNLYFGWCNVNKKPL